MNTLEQLFLVGCPVSLFHCLWSCLELYVHSLRIALYSHINVLHWKNDSCNVGKYVPHVSSIYTVHSDSLLMLLVLASKMWYLFRIDFLKICNHKQIWHSSYRGYTLFRMNTFLNSSFEHMVKKMGVIWPHHLAGSIYHTLCLSKPVFTFSTLKSGLFLWNPLLELSDM